MTTNYTMELTRHGVTPAGFLAYVRKQAKKHGIPVDVDTEYFVNGEKVNGEYWNTSYSGGTPSTRPAYAEIVKAMPYEQQTYVKNFDGSVYNEIVEFTFDDEKTGHGYYYIISTDAEPGDAEKAKETEIRVHENKSRMNANRIRKNDQLIADAETDAARGWRDAEYVAGYVLTLRMENRKLSAENDAHAAAVAELSGNGDGPDDGRHGGKKNKGYDIRKMYDVVNGAIASDRAAFHEPRDNSKLRGIPAFNLMPGKTCSPDACAHCLREGCYAVKNACCHGYNLDENNCLRAWTENTALAFNHLRELEKALDAWLTKNRPALFRIHSSGDMFSVEYARMWRRIATRHAETRFLAFTKQFDVVRHVHFYKLANFELVLSGWTGIRVPDDLRKHYRVAWCNDGTETRIPADAIHCPGDCNACRACWFLSRIGKDSYFDKH